MKLLTILLLGGFLMSSTSSVASIINVDEDTYIDRFFSDDVFGSLDYLRVSGQSGAGPQIILLKFDNLPDNIDSIELFIHPYSTYPTLSIPLYIHCVESDWDEEDTTWNSVGGEEIVSDKVISTAEFIGGYDWLIFDIPIDEWENVNYGLIIKKESPGYLSFFSRNTINYPQYRPYLMVTTTGIAHTSLGNIKASFK